MELLIRMKCSDASVLLNPTANLDTFEDFRCHCELGAAVCPANFTEGEVPMYQAVTMDTFYDLSNKDIALWIIRTYREYKKKRFVNELCLF